MQLDLARNESIVSSNPTTAYMKTRAVRMGVNNYVNYTVNVRSLVDISGTPTKSLQFLGEGSNDGVNWTAITGLSLNISAQGLSNQEGEAPYGWLRFDVALGVGGTAGDVAEAVFDLQANVMRK